jgi:hypothetical protein
MEPDDSVSCTQKETAIGSWPSPPPPHTHTHTDTDTDTDKQNLFNKKTSYPVNINLFLRSLVPWDLSAEMLCGLRNI